MEKNKIERIILLKDRLDKVDRYLQLDGLYIGYWGIFDDIVGFKTWDSLENSLKQLLKEEKEKIEKELEEL